MATIYTGVEHWIKCSHWCSLDLRKDVRIKYFLFSRKNGTAAKEEQANVTMSVTVRDFKQLSMRLVR